MDDEEFKRTVRERFDVLGHRLEGVGRRLGAVHRRIDAADRRFDVIDRRLNAIVARLDQQDEAHGNLHSKVDRLQKAVLSLTESVEQSLGLLTNLSRPA